MEHTYSIKTRVIWFFERMFDNLSTKLQSMRVDSQLKDIGSQNRGSISCSK
jgi:hypothetical protein